MVSFATQGTFESKQFQPMFLLALNRVISYGFDGQRGNFIFLQKSAIPATLTSGIFHTFRQTFTPCTTMVRMAQFCSKNNLHISLLKH